MKILNLDLVPEKKVNLVVKLLFPTKRETASHFAVSFESPSNHAWFAFKPNVPENVQREVIEIVESYQ